MTLRVREDGIWKPVGGSAPPPSGDGWQRPADWLPLPTLTGSDRQFSALVAVSPFESNYLSFSVAGAYQVDWGDGSAVETFASGTQAHHQYHFSDLDASTWCSRGYRQAVVTVTPTTATWTSVNLNVRNSSWIPTNNTSNSILDIVVAGSTITGCTINGTSRQAYMLEQFRQVGTWGVDNFYQMFNGCSSLQSIPELDTSSGTIFTDIFSGCSSLQSVPELDTSSGTGFSSMFANCSSLQSVPELDTSSGTIFTSMFTNCSSLQSVPELDTSSGTNFSQMFNGCSSLQSIPELDTSSGTNFSNMFLVCRSLQDAPLQGTTRALSVTATLMSREALVRLFNGLGTASGAQTLTITNTPGASQLTTPERQIATNKGWTISG